MSVSLFPKETLKSDQKPLISVRGVWKSFPGVIALKNVNLDIFRGEIHAILGENGAGKSTLVKILYGVYVPDSGEIFIEGRKKIITSPIDAMREGIVLVSQVPQLIDSLTISENLLLSLTACGLFDRISSVEKMLLKKSKEYGIKIDPNIEVWKLSYTQKQLVELLRALLVGAKVIALDEALTLLPYAEKRRIYEFVKMFKERGGSVILITHKIPEALEMSDTITVLRRGEVVGTVKASEATLNYVRSLMFGEKAAQISYARIATSNVREEVLLDVNDLWVLNDYGAYAVRGVSFKLRKGEVLGIAGVAGNGQLELIQALVGLRKVVRGRILIKQNNTFKDITNASAIQIRRLGVGFIPDEPLKRGVTIENTIVENIAVHPAIVNTIIKWSKVKHIARQLVEEFSIVTPSLNSKVKVLSGGNLMKVLVARELFVTRNLLVAYNPTRALDEVSALMVRKLIKRKAVEEGVAAVVASEDLDEVLQISDTVAVMNSGSFVGVFRGEDVNRTVVEGLMVR